jgi:hypothetical protein
VRVIDVALLVMDWAVPCRTKPVSKQQRISCLITEVWLELKQLRGVFIQTTRSLKKDRQQ